MRLAYASDLHNEFYATPPALPRVDADVLILAGDIQTVKSHNYDWWEETCRHYKDVIYIPGNHEYYKSYFADAPDLNFPRNVIAVGRGSSFIDIDGLRILAGTMWTDLTNPSDEWLAKAKMNDYKQIKYSRERWWFTPGDTTRAFHSFMADLEFHKPDVVVTHHLPSYGSVPQEFKDDRLNSAYASEVDMEGIKLWIHGHTHTPCDYVKQGCRVVCNPKGYPGQKSSFDYTPKVIDYAV